MNKFDVAIIGAGPAGMTAALYALRANLNVALIDYGVPGGQMNNTLEIENYPGFKIISGQDLSNSMYEQIEEYSNLEFIFDKVEKINNPHDKIKEIILESGDMIKTKTIVVASGSTHKHLGVPGEDEFNARGVSYCAVCDGHFFKDKEVIVVGGGDSALEEALYLSKIVKKVYIVHRRDEFRGQQIYQDRVKATSNIDLILSANVTEIVGTNEVKSVVIKQGDTEFRKLIGGVFIYVGLKPNTHYLKDLPELLTAEGFVKTEDTKTYIPGIYAVGDVREKDLRQISTAVGDGAIAGQEVYNYIVKNFEV